MIDLNNLTRDAQVKKQQERLEKITKELERVLIENQTTLAEAMTMFESLKGFYQRKASNEYIIK